MKILVLCPGKIPNSISEVKCFTDVLNFYLPKALSKIADVTIKTIPRSNDIDGLRHVFSTIDVESYKAIITLGLRFYSKIPTEVTKILRDRFRGLLCQTYDGSRLDSDPVDITFTFKDDTMRMSTNENRLKRHNAYNIYMGWAADPDLNVPNQHPSILRILVDHTNYGDNEVDYTDQVLESINKFINSKIWRKKYTSVTVRRFDSGEAVDVVFDNQPVQKYDRSKSIPITEISKEHSAAHIFCVTHPESVGLVVLETSMAGALTVTPKDCIPKDRLATVRHYEYENEIDWEAVLNKISIAESRTKAKQNSWDGMARRIVTGIIKRLKEQ